MEPFDVVGLGQCCIDHLGQVDPFPLADQKAEFHGFARQGGGPVATAMVTTARLGLRTAFLGKVGDDSFGTEIIQELNAEGIDTRGVVVAPGKTSQFAFIAVEKQRPTRTVFWTRGTAHPLLPREIRTDVLLASRYLHLDGLHVDASLEAARLARAAGIPVMLDSGTLREEYRPLLPLVDHLAVSEGFARAFAGSDDPALGLRALQAAGPRFVCITLGERGCVGMHDGRIVRQPAWPVPVVDTTGCGDTFHGGLIYALLQGWDLAERLAFASAVAALKCRRMGGRAGLPSLAEVRAFMASHGPITRETGATPSSHEA